MNIITWGLSILLALAAGGIGSIFTMSEIPGWYATLVKPAISPPNWIFGPVWTTLYVLMGTAAWLVWQKGWDTPGVKLALSLYMLQLILNALWSFLFFGMHALGLAFLELVLLWLSIAGTMVLFYALSPLAAVLLIPYLAWVSFAGYLNYLLYTLNS